MQRLGNGHSNVFAPVAAEAAYRHGGPWLDELLDYLNENATYVQRELAKLAPEIKVVKPEGTFVLWLDCRELGLPSEELNQFFVEKARLALNDGSAFGESGAGYLRMNIGCPRSLITEALERIKKALAELP